MPEQIAYTTGAPDEKDLILKAYKALLRALKPTLGKGDKKTIRLAFDMALEAEKYIAKDASLIRLWPLVSVPPGDRLLVDRGIHLREAPQR